MAKLKVKKLNPEAKEPTKAHPDDAAYDLYAMSRDTLQLPTGPVIEYDTGIAVVIPKGYAGICLPRSGITTKTSLVLGNSCGLIDPGYNGSIKFQFRANSTHHVKAYEIGDRIGQILIVKGEFNDGIELVDELPKSDRGTTGFGSSGVK